MDDGMMPESGARIMSILMLKRSTGWDAALPDATHAGSAREVWELNDAGRQRLAAGPPATVCAAIEARLAAGGVGLMIVAEAGDIGRSSIRWFEFVKQCVAANTRLIVLDALVDTACEGWETKLHIAAVLHSVKPFRSQRHPRR